MKTHSTTPVSAVIGIIVSVASVAAFGLAAASPGLATRTWFQASAPALVGMMAVAAALHWHNRKRP
jgi:hypothetical protein